MCSRMKSLEAQAFFEFHLTLFAVLVFIIIIVLPALRLIVSCVSKKEGVYYFVSKFSARIVSNSRLELSLLLIVFIYILYFIFYFIYKYCG
ncbi:hypothetical protein S4054249_13525 [Pseudoalteromonas luteoviolacea]|nr:hypothetical protein S4054249_13525 [Pseudoalteromonas luteoviolacea]AOT13724.1 hypothetical protein S40542_13495 [Pseudoalteromonas luteoviolacea]AOT18638.1 hypothetical protein S4054_13500 [Pseudoalteromonas luteoviolacea]KZN72818.1 hypothetical protein N481_14425 [Pseudoalteromonas luteoviolacea S4047-1]